MLFQKCAIIGNGPSLKYTLENEHDFLENTELFCVNLFATHKQYQILKPKNYILHDPVYGDESHTEAQKAIKGIVDNTTWEINLFVPFQLKKSSYFVSEMSKNAYIHVKYYNYTIVEGFQKLSFWLFNKGLAMPQSQNVIIAALFMTIYLGYKEIFLFGADQSWHEIVSLDEHNKLTFEMPYFYEKKALDITKIKKGNGSYLAQLFLSTHKVFKGFEVLADYAISKGSKVYNASARSYIDVFEKIKINEFKR